MKKKSINIALTPKTDDSELLCRDGEVEAFVNVPWLGNAENESGISGEGKIVRYSAVSGPVGINTEPFPSGSVLLCIHRPMGDENSPMAIIRQPDAALASRRLGTSGAPDRIGILPRTLGSVRCLLPWRDIITVVGSTGVAWLLYDSSSQSYKLLTSLPEAPAISFDSDDAHLENYTQFAGADPEMDVEVDLHDVQDMVDADLISDWLDNGHGQRVDKIIKQRVFDSVGRRIGLFEDDVRQAGMILSPTACIAAFGSALPSEISVTADGYSPPSAKLLSWNLSGATLSLLISFSLRPQRLSATFTLSSLQLAWRKIFNSLDVYIADTPRWWIPAQAERTARPVVTGLTSLRPDDSSGFAFRFRCRSREALLAEARNMKEFRRSLKIDLTSISEGVTLLPLPPESAAAIRPDYTDFEPLRPAGAALTDEGVVIWEGRRLLTPMKENRVVYRHRNLISDSPILAACRSMTRSKGNEETGRHTLLLFCRDGIRQVEADGAGGYRNIRFLSGVTLYSSSSSGQEMDCHNHIAVYGSSMLFLSSRGLESISSSGNLKTMAPYPSGISGYEVENLLIDESSSTALLNLADGSIRFWSFDDEEWYGMDDTIEGLDPTPIPYENRNIQIDSDGNLSRLVIERKVTVEVEEDAGRMMRSLPGALPPMTGKCGIMTRALKFDAPFRRKRITSISSAVEASFRIEGSDDLTDWQLLAEGVSPRRSLHTAACRFFRIRLIVEAALASHLTGFSLNYSVD